MEIANERNCKDGLTHLFLKIRDKGLIFMIRNKFPELKFSLWECKHCDKIIEST